jgi:hypothetical protein
MKKKGFARFGTKTISMQKKHLEPRSGYVCKKVNKYIEIYN